MKTTSNVAVLLTGERMLTKYTGGPERPSRDDIARLANHFYETRGQRDGRDLDDGFAAERELTRHLSVLAEI